MTATAATAAPVTELARFQRFYSEVLDLTLEQFQIEIAEEVFSDRREALILLPRGNGKSTLLAAIGLWHLLSRADPQIAVGAASREQAAVLFDIARGMAAHPVIAPRVEITRREIRTPTGFLKSCRLRRPEAARLDSHAGDCGRVALTLPDSRSPPTALPPMSPSE